MALFHQIRPHDEPRKPKVANATPVANKPVSNVANPKPKDRVTKWREANPELYKERQAAYMRKRRAADKAKRERE